MYFFTFHCEPKNYTDNIAGAYINCWINSNNIIDAENIAMEKIRADNWEILSLDEKKIIPKGYYDDNSTGLKYYKQALIDDWVIVIHTYPEE